MKKNVLKMALVVVMVAGFLMGCGKSDLTGNDGHVVSKSEGQINIDSEASDGNGSEMVKVTPKPVGAAKFNNVCIVEKGEERDFYKDLFSDDPEATAEDDYFFYTIYDGFVSAYYKGGLGTKVEFPAEYKGMPVRAIAKGDYICKDEEQLSIELAKVEEVIIPDTVWGLDCISFENYSSLKEIRLSKNLVSVLGLAFQNCTSLQELDFPKSVRYVGSRVASGCENLQVMYVHSTDIECNNDTFDGSEVKEFTYIP